ncbi:DEAD/DEAH box helicase [Clostridium perfringens]|uniref:DEAD/DEAH box helicase family protein n=1 Tax=Clostridium perfringens TaxID=1502 RepID=A0AAW4J4U0_CLOPF|nr:DEAD/DEAH box helicase family protein [Clostridium perfringens]MDU2175969.1 DEAD/DEAH box helicase family protein [Clostridioides difficile]EHK2403125.1 DEAD/DEAH box helicase family protein [Clostridium perfringens]EHP47385.1 hypothetical protein HMPREF9476_02124 [Clostridium perfringens WAL-14572]MBO3355795.1 DEAD/DEAH box helicase family protein [Clostridium perfringens]MBO3359066.1 DEAD/DEAH box helicase family protein [Clostridium perfringens]
MFNIDDLFAIESEEKFIEPDKIFASLLKDSKYEYLRDIQTEILNLWFSERNEKDTILKMNTGAGKTLVGLLMLQSSLNEGVGPAVYICPNLQLVDQVIENSKLYGIKCVTFEENSSSFPSEFLENDAILVTVFDKVFNGRSIFEKYDISIGTILFDDAHACISKAREKFTIKIERSSDLYMELFNLFQTSLEEQDLGSTKSIYAGGSSTIMQVPYWTWISNLEEIARKFSNIAEAKVSYNDSTRLNIFFNWPLLKSNLKNCNVFISGNCIEITPHCLPIDKFTYFKNAKRRIFMSATLLDDSSLIRELNITSKAIKNPLVNTSSYNIGERMILIPTLIHNSLKTDRLPKIFSDVNQNKIVLVPSNYKGYTNKWIENSAELLDSSSINAKIKTLKDDNNSFFVLANRYDGIDLHGDQCRVLIMEGLALSATLYERFLKGVRPNSKIMKIILSQQIEQGIGRSTRSSNDYSVVILTGADLETFILSKENLKYLSAQTRKQIEIGKEFVKKLDCADEEKAEESMKQVMNAQFTRNPSWIKFHSVKLQQAKQEEFKKLPLELALAERKAYDLANSNNYEDAAKTISDIINKLKDDLDESDIGWYMQIEASYLYNYNKEEALLKQKKAHEYNTNICKSLDGLKYKKILKKTSRQSKKILEYVNKFSDGNGIIVDVNNILQNLEFGKNSNKFEESLKKLGEFLGYYSQRPEKEFKNGLPDGLWKMSNNEYIIFEAKNETLASRKVIYKDEAEQITNSYNWFKNEYTNSSDNEIIGYPVLIHQTNKTDDCAYPDDSVRILTNNELQKLKKNSLDFAKVLASNFNENIDEAFINKNLESYKLTFNKFINNYTIKFM